MPNKVNVKTETEPVESSKSSTKDAYSVSNILLLIPKTYRKRGEILINCLLKHEDKIRWDEKGTVIIRDNAIPFSNITELINNVLRKLKRPLPLGGDLFTKVLSEIQVPLRCIGNPNVREHMGKTSIEYKHTPHSIDTTPHRTSEDLKIRKK